jgi:hypothetical protein
VKYPIPPATKEGEQPTNAPTTGKDTSNDQGGHAAE